MGDEISKFKIRQDLLMTLNDFQMSLGDINWICPKLGIATYQLKHTYQTPQGDLQIDSPLTLNMEAS